MVNDKSRINSKTSPKVTKVANQSEDMKTMKVFPLERINFILMIAAAVVIIVGFMLMLGGSTTPEAFNDDIFSKRRVIVGPTIAFIGFLFMGFAIIYRPRESSSIPEDVSKEV